MSVQVIHSIHFVYGNHDLWRGAGRFVQGLNFRADMQIRPYGFGEDYTDTTQSPQCICARHLPSAEGEWSAPTVHGILFQQPRMPSPTDGSILALTYLVPLSNNSHHQLR